MIAVRLRCSLARLAFFLMIGGACWPETAAALSPNGPLSIVEPNDNLRAAGTRDGGTLTVALRAGLGRWHPEGPAGPALEIEAFGEVGKALTVPAPLIRVVEGTEIVVSIRNDLEAALIVHGLCTRDRARAAHPWRYRRVTHARCDSRAGRLAPTTIGRPRLARPCHSANWLVRWLSTGCLAAQSQTGSW